MGKEFKGTINIDIKDSTPDWEPYAQPIAPEGTPNVLYVVLDDVGFSAMESFGGLIETPNIKRIADRGLLYTNFHTTALCSPTRTCLLTGRNHHSNAMASIVENASGFPGYTGEIPFENGFLSEMLTHSARVFQTAAQVALLTYAEDIERLVAETRHQLFGGGRKGLELHIIRKAGETRDARRVGQQVEYRDLVPGSRRPVAHQ